MTEQVFPNKRIFSTRITINPDTNTRACNNQENEDQDSAMLSRHLSFYHFTFLSSLTGSLFIEYFRCALAVASESAQRRQHCSFRELSVLSEATHVASESSPYSRTLDAYSRKYFFCKNTVLDAGLHRSCRPVEVRVFVATRGSTSFRCRVFASLPTLPKP